MSCQTRTCASQSGPAPMPTVGNVELCGDLSCQVTGHHLQNHTERPRLGYGVRIVKQAASVIAATLHPVSAKLVFALRGKADMAHDRDASVSDLADLLGYAYPTLELHGVTAALLHKADRGLQGLRRSVLVRAEGQVSDDESSLRGLHHGAHQRQQLLNRDRQRGLVGVDIVGGGVTDQQRPDARLVEQLGGVLVIAGQHGPALVLALCGVEVGDADPAHRRRTGVGHCFSLTSEEPNAWLSTAGLVPDLVEDGAGIVRLARRADYPSSGIPRLTVSESGENQR